MQSQTDWFGNRWYIEFIFCSYSLTHLKCIRPLPCLNIQIYNISNSILDTAMIIDNVTDRSTPKFMKALDTLCRFMDSRNFALCNGAVFKLILEAKYIYVYYGLVNTFHSPSLENATL